MDFGGRSSKRFLVAGDYAALQHRTQQPSTGGWKIMFMRASGGAPGGVYTVGVTQTLAMPDRSAAKAERYRALADEIEAVLEGEADRVARMATVAAMLATAFDCYSWTGFYGVDPARAAELVVGPYQGTFGLPAHRLRARGVWHGGGGEAHGDRAGCERLRRPHRLRFPVSQRDRRAGVRCGGRDVRGARRGFHGTGGLRRTDARGLEAIVRRVFAA